VNLFARLLVYNPDRVKELVLRGVPRNSWAYMYAFVRVHSGLAQHSAYVRTFMRIWPSYKRKIHPIPKARTEGRRETPPYKLVATSSLGEVGLNRSTSTVPATTLTSHPSEGPSGRHGDARSNVSVHLGRAQHSP
jgi:hypothetical protein